MQGILHLVKSEQNVRVLWHFLKRWQAWDIWRGSGKISFAWQAQYKRHVHQSYSKVRALISWERLHFGASDLQVCWDDFAWLQHFVWLGSTFTWQAQHFRHMNWKNRKTHWYEAVSSALNFPFLKEVSQNCCQLETLRKSRRIASFLMCQDQKLRKSRRITAFLMLSWTKIEEVSQNCFVFKLGDR